MNLLVKSTLISSFLFASFVHAAEKIFDLQEQYFSETMTKENDVAPKIGHYDLPNVVFNTNSRLLKTKAYSGNKFSAFMTITVKEPVSNWQYIEDRISHIGEKSDRNYGADAVIRLTSESGNSFYISINRYRIIVNDKKFPIEMTSETNYNIAVKKQDNLFIAKINGQTLLKTTIDEFGKLAKIETTIPFYEGQYSNGYSDSIQQIELYER